MHIKTLDHVNLRTAKLSQMITWYEAVLGMKEGARPDFPFPGAWLYAGERAFVHLVGIDGAGATGSEADLKLEHFAFSASDAAGFEARLVARKEAFRKVEIPETGVVAYNIWDPDGNHIHVDFAVPE